MNIQSIRNGISIAPTLWRGLAGLIFCAFGPLVHAQTAPLFISQSPANGTVGTAYSHTFAANGTDPIAFSK